MTVDLRAERLNRGLTITAAADQMGVARNTLYSIERGETRPHANTAFRVASFYGLKVTDVWPLEPEPAAGALA